MQVLLKVPGVNVNIGDIHNKTPLFKVKSNVSNDKLSFFSIFTFFLLWLISSVLTQSITLPCTSVNAVSFTLYGSEVSLNGDVRSGHF